MASDSRDARAALDMVNQQLRPRGVRDEAVLAAMLAVPRHRFVPRAQRSRAYEDAALPTADGQTISQPYIVALMTELLQVRAGQRVLEVGGGSGYQAAVLAEMGARVVSVECNARLADHARWLLGSLGYGALVEVVTADGSLGWPALQPFDRIVVAAAAPHLPDPLRRQLADAGRLVIPIGTRAEQRLVTFARHGSRWERDTHIPVRFVPLLGRHGFEASA